jgi:hypothetical protein
MKRKIFRNFGGSARHGETMTEESLQAQSGGKPQFPTRCGVAAATVPPSQRN